MFEVCICCVWIRYAELVYNLTSWLLVTPRLNKTTYFHSNTHFTYILCPAGRTGIKLIWHPIYSFLKMKMSYLVVSWPLISNAVQSCHIYIYVLNVLSSYPNLSYPILTYPNQSYPILSYPNPLILSTPILSNPVLLCPIQAYSLLSSPVMSYENLFCLIQSCYVLSNSDLPYAFQSCHCPSCPVFCLMSCMQKFTIRKPSSTCNNMILRLKVRGVQGRRNTRLTINILSIPRSHL